MSKTTGRTPDLARASQYLPQDNEGLREHIEQGFASFMSAVEGWQAMMVGSPTQNDMKELERIYQKHSDSVLALFQAEQTRLKADLIAKVREMLPEAFGDTWYAPSATAQVSAALDTLERGA